MTEILKPADAPELRSAFVAPLHDIEWRQAGNGEDYTFTGSAVVFNSWSEELWTPLGVFRERILPGAFDEVLARDPDVRLLLNHDPNLVLARTKAHTLELTADEDALRVWARVAPTSYARDLRMSMQRGDIDQMSFMFEMDEERGALDRWYEDEDSGEIRRDVIKASDLLDTSPVTFPAYLKTTAAMRELELRSAAAAGKIVLPNPVAEAETDPPGNAPSGASEEAAPAEIDPVGTEEDPLAALRERTKSATQRERESYLRLLKEITRD